MNIDEKINLFQTIKKIASDPSISNQQIADIMDSFFVVVNKSTSENFTNFVETVNGVLVNNADPKNPIINTPTPYQIGAATSEQGGKADTAVQPLQIQDFETSAMLDARDNRNRSRVNHTGTQTTSTISDFNESVSTNESVSANAQARHIHTNKSVLDNTTAYFTTEKDTKLASLESSKFLGTFVSFASLQTSHPEPSLGSYAYVDQGGGSNITQYIWDDTDNSYVETAGEANAETPASIKIKYESNADTNVFDDSAKTKLSGVSTGATANDTDANLKNRTNHTGIQLASTISNFSDTVLGSLLTGISFASSSAVTAADTILSAIGKFEKRISTIVSSQWTTVINGISYSLGRVGIGTTTPQTEFEVVGDIIHKGTKWVSRTTFVDNDWRSVTYGNGLFVAVSYSGTGNRVMTSPDGINWTTRTSPANNNWNSITYGNGLFVAVAGSGSGNRVMTSPDGISWTLRNSAADLDWRSVTYNNGIFVAVAQTGTGNRVMTSIDGIIWTSRTSIADNNWMGITWGNGLFVAVATTGTGNRVMTSPDGITWTARTSAFDNGWMSVVYANGLFVAVAGSGTGNRVMTSPDGINWTSRISASDNEWRSVTYGNGIFVAVAGTGTGTRVMTSPDGINWLTRASSSDNVWNSITYGNGSFVAVAQTGTGNRVMTSGKMDAVQPAIGQIPLSVRTITSSATPTPTGSSRANELYITAQAVNATIAAPTSDMGVPENGNQLIIRITPTGSYTLAYNAIYEAVGVTLPTTITNGKEVYMECRYNSISNKWQIISVSVKA